MNFKLFYKNASNLFEEIVFSIEILHDFSFLRNSLVLATNIIIKLFFGNA